MELILIHLLHLAPIFSALLHALSTNQKGTASGLFFLFSLVSLPVLIIDNFFLTFSVHISISLPSLFRRFKKKGLFHGKALFGSLLFEYPDRHYRRKVCALSHLINFMHRLKIFVNSTTSIAGFRIRF